MDEPDTNSSEAVIMFLIC